MRRKRRSETLTKFGEKVEYFNRFKTSTKLNAHTNFKNSRQLTYVI